MRFSVGRRAYETLEKYFSSAVGRWDVDWVDFLHAMCAIGFQGRSCQGSAWMFHREHSLWPKGTQPISFHEPYPNSYHAPQQVFRAGKRLKKVYGLCMALLILI